MLKYVKGDATNPQDEGIKVIAHINNDIGGWGRGFVVALSKRWKLPETEYRQWHSAQVRFGATPFGPFKLGAVQFVKVERDIFIANMVGQHGMYNDDNGNPPIRYDAVRECLKKVCEFAKEHKASIHSPRFGAGLAGGKWEEIEKIINEELVAHGVEVVIYDLE